MRRKMALATALFTAVPYLLALGAPRDVRWSIDASRMVVLGAVGVACASATIEAVPRHVPNHLIVWFKRGTVSLPPGRTESSLGMATFASVNLKATMRDLGVIALSMLTPTATEANLRSVDPSGGRIELDKSQLDMYVVTMADSTLSAPIVALTADTAHVVAVEPDWLRRTQLTPNDSLFANQWWLANTGTNAGYPGAVPGADLGAIGAWSLTIGSDRQIPVVVIDTGCNLSHPDFSPGPGHPSRVIAGPDFIQGGTVEGE